MNDLVITIIQSNLHWENKKENLLMFSEKINTITQATDLIILPEMFSTGFTMNAETFSESMNDQTVSWMKEKAKEKNCSIVGSFICKEESKFYNRLLWMNKNGTYSVYDKKHLFSMANENNYYTAGNKKLMIELNGWKICPLICYDLRFPEWTRNDKNNTYDVLLYVANWPEKRIHAWKTLLQARAIENQSYVIGVNRTGEDGNGIYYSGDSAVINPKGETISKTKPHEEETETILLNYNDLIAYRKIFPVLNDIS